MVARQIIKARIHEFVGSSTGGDMKFVLIQQFNAIKYLK